MAKRIFAWFLIAGFVLLIANIAFIGYQRAASVIIYAVIILGYVFIFNAGRKKEE